MKDLDSPSLVAAEEFVGGGQREAVMAQSFGVPSVHSSHVP